MTLSCTDMTLEKEKINFNDAWICNYRITQPTEHNWMFIPSIWVYSCLESISKLVIYIVTLNKNRFTVKDFQSQFFSHRISSLSSPKVNCFLMIFFPNKLLPALKWQSPNQAELHMRKWQRSCLPMMVAWSYVEGFTSTVTLNFGWGWITNTFCYNEEFVLKSLLYWSLRSTTVREGGGGEREVRTLRFPLMASVGPLPSM